MKTLGRAAILLACYVFPASAQQVLPNCAAPPSTFRKTWYIDPVHGKTQAAGGNGSQATPGTPWRPSSERRQAIRTRFLQPRPIDI